MTFSCDDIFVPISCEEPPYVFPRRHEHPVPLQGLSQPGPIPTNKFYANLFLNNRTEGVWCQPYRLSHTNFNNEQQTFGMAVSHVETFEQVLGPDPNAERVDYYYNPRGPPSLNLSAQDLTRDARMSLEEASESSVTVCLRGGDDQTIRFPLVQGMGFVTAIYENLDPLVTTGVDVKYTTRHTLERNGQHISKTRMVLSDGSVWLLYVLDTRAPPNASLQVRQLENRKISVTSPFSGVVQVAKCPSTACEELYDRCAGAFTQTVQYSGSLSDTAGRYTFSFQRADGMAGVPLLMFALPHHVASFDEATREGVRHYARLQSTTKGSMTAVVGDSWTMVESDCPVHLATNFIHDRPVALPVHMRTKIVEAARVEIEHDIRRATNCNTIYFSGKAMDKYAQLCWAASAYGDEELATPCLEKVEEVWNLFAANAQQVPLLYETAWKGLVSSAGYTTGDILADFGSSCYNDHHFHYSYFIHAAAVIAKLKSERGDRTWIERNHTFVDTLLRDAANPSKDDPFFPVFRSFDWFNGHSWAKGLFESVDGKDEESTSEDVHFAYASQLWGVVADNPALAARSTLMLAILRRSCNAYFYMRSTNPNHPRKFAANRVAGITFENKVDHTTYFSNAIECIHGIHMLPVTPASIYIRDPEWCEEEWATWFSNGRVDTVPGGWRGVLYASTITWDPQRATDWFFSDTFDWDHLDGGMSLAYYRALAVETLRRISG